MTNKNGNFTSMSCLPIKCRTPGVDEIAKKIPEFLKADKELLEQMSHNMKETDENLKKLYL
jgi:hypothetical protein